MVRRGRDVRAEDGCCQFPGRRGCGALRGQPDRGDLRGLPGSEAGVAPPVLRVPGEVLPGVGRRGRRHDGQAFPKTISRTAAVVAPGLMVMAIILFMGKVSGAHLNPAVSIAFAVRGDSPWQR